MTGSAIQHEVPGLKEINAVDAAGVHPLLLAIGSERYTPYAQTKQPAELLTIANHVLGTGQLSLAKFLFITADDANKLSTHNIQDYLYFILQRIDLSRDVHFYTKTSIDTLDYSGESLNSGSKVVLAAYGDVKRELATEVPNCLNELKYFDHAKLVIPGIVAIQTSKFSTYENAIHELDNLNQQLSTFNEQLSTLPFIIVCDDADFVSKTLNNFLWVTFTRCNPSHDLYGLNSVTKYKHWGCSTLIFDARIKPHHAPPVLKDEAVEKRIDKIFEKGGSLYSMF